MQIMEENKHYNAAVAYCEMLGWKIFPLVPGGKNPITKHGFHDATDNVNQIKEWWDLYPNAGIGTPTGEINNFLVIDIDPRNGGDVSFQRLQEKYQPFPHTVESITGGGGNHFFFKWDDRINKSKLENYPGVDIQGNGAYVVLPPSIHPDTKKSYEWELSSKPVMNEMASVPKYFVDLMHEKDKEKKAKPVGDYLEILSGVGDGNRNDSLLSIIGYLLSKKIDYRIAYELVCLWNERNDPPLEDNVVITAFNNILRKEAEK